MNITTDIATDTLTDVAIETPSKTHAPSVFLLFLGIHFRLAEATLIDD